MMGRQSGQISMLILDIEELIPENHLLRKINQMISFDFTSTWERRSRSRLMSIPLLCSSGTASLRNKGRYRVGQMGENPASYTARQ